ncbi:MAG: endonuclease III [Candidatus Marsarchaeota archaeon]|nr:endonuclease III [Candidatus Marsarchaeota archaeon]
MRKEAFSQKKARAARVLLIFKKHYPKAWCTLDFKTPFQLLVSTILSAQCTDARVNLVTPKLFKKYPNAASMSRASISSLESLIRSTGFYHSKAKALKETSKALVKNFGGKVPSDMASLLTLHGVARKTANIVLFHSFGQNEGIAVDTHCMRLSYRLGFTSSRDKQNKIEQELMALIPRASWGMYTNWMVTHGRKYCTAIKPDCAGCPLNKLCPSAFKV